ncbi:MAG: sulfite exporter TauE/SafE family protein [bacterium]|nr:sulfite exporter TauE/SafE family protein [Candidatus Sumerlaeota bacterium]
MQEAIGYIAIGLIGGIFGGLVGLGGGIVIVPMLVYVYGFSQHKAQGTTLAMMLPPIGVFAVLEYYRQGAVDFRVAAILCVGFLAGGYLGAKLALWIPGAQLQKVFGVFLMIMAVKMIFFTR